MPPSHIQLLPWPAFIPDMSPTKNAWNLLGGHVHQRQPQSMTTAQLQYALIQDWRAILQQQSQTLVQTMCRQVNASITPRGVMWLQFQTLHNLCISDHKYSLN
uniref:Uncharacterized protein n=1 Tax=Pundamilia nyererei TaxID=303518 RepID=A0A3B4F9A0_9CICH